jgi:glycosyltransferase involved in cell wall biosynthesis
LIHDVYDLWPEFFSRVFPKPFQRLANLLFTPLYLWRQRNWSHADAVAALAADYLQVPLRSVPQLRSRPSLLAYNGIDVKALRSIIEVYKRELSWKHYDSSKVQAIYAGGLGASYDIITLLSACDILRKKMVPLKVMIAGDGPLRTLVEKYVNRIKDGMAEYLGKLAPATLFGIYARSEIG